MSKLKTIFMGTPDFAVPCLEVLQAKTEVLAVITQPDRPKGRGHNLQASPVKQKALEYNLPVLQPEKIKTEEFDSSSGLWSDSVPADFGYSSFGLC